MFEEQATSAVWKLWKHVHVQEQEIWEAVSVTLWASWHHFCITSRSPMPPNPLSSTAAGYLLTTCKSLATTEGTTINSLMASHWFPVMWQKLKAATSDSLKRAYTFERAFETTNTPHQRACFYTFKLTLSRFTDNTRLNIDWLTQKGRLCFTGGDSKPHTNSECH